MISGQWAVSYLVEECVEHANAEHLTSCKRQAKYEG